MKIKAVVHPDSPPEFIKFLNEEIGINILNEVLVPCLHVSKDFGPAEAYIQECDLARGCNPGFLCEVRLTGVSLNRKRAVDDFDRTKNELVRLYREAIKRFFPKGKRVQLFISVMVDKPLPLSGENLLETDPEWVEGEAA